MITRSEYLAKKQKIDGKLAELDAELEEAKAVLADAQRILDGVKKIGHTGEMMEDQTAEYAGADSPDNEPQDCKPGGRPKTGILTRALVEAFIEDIYIYDADHIEIVFKCEDVIKAAIDMLPDRG